MHSDRFLYSSIINCSKLNEEGITSIKRSYETIYPGNKEKIVPFSIKSSLDSIT